MYKKMKKWIIRILWLQVALIGVLAALPVAVPIWQEYRPPPVARVDAAMRRAAPGDALNVATAHLLAGAQRVAGARAAVPKP